MARGIRLLLLTCLWLVPTLLFSKAFMSDWSEVWEAVRVPAWGVSFLDIRSITSGIETMQHGADPLVKNKPDPFQRPMNYPRIWLYLFRTLRISNANVHIVGLLFSALYLLCISSLMARSETVWQALVVLVAGLSLSPLLAMERGNTDLCVFSLVLLGCLTNNKYAKSAAFFAATMLKIFPFSSLVIDTLGRKGKERLWALAFTGLAMVGLAWQWHDLHAIREATPVSVYLSYGVTSLRAQAAYLSGTLLVSALVVAFLIVGISWRICPQPEERLLQSKAGELFLVFGGIYVFTFLAGSNWNYRLLFLVPTLVLALEWIRAGQNVPWGMAYVIAVLVAENSFLQGPYQGIPLGDLATFVLFSMILIVLLRTAKHLLLPGPRLAWETGTRAAAAKQGSV